MALDLPGLAAYLAEHHHHDLIRVETLDHYTSASDGTEFARYRAGESEPDRTSKAAWLDRLRDDTASGRPWRRLRVITPPLSDYVRYSCEWGYTDNTAAGEQIRILDLAAAPPGSDVLLRLGDFYLLDHAHAAAMRYDPTGRFIAADTVPEPLTEVYRSAATAGWELAEPFEHWWNRHPEHHRAPAAG